MSMNTLDRAPLGADPWALTEETPAEAPDSARAALLETLFCVGNGRIGVRGAHEEVNAEGGNAWPGAHNDAVFINGFYDTHPIHHPENAYGLARENQFMVAVPNGKSMSWSIDGEAFDPRPERISHYQRCFDLHSGVLTREFIWATRSGQRVAVRSQRLASLTRQAVYAQSFELTLLDKAATLSVDAIVDARQRPQSASDDPRVGSANAATALQLTATHRHPNQHPSGVLMQHRTRHSGLALTTAMQAEAWVDGVALQGSPCGGDDCPGQRFATQLRVGQRLVLHKYIAMATAAEPHSDSACVTAMSDLHLASTAGFHTLMAEQQAYLDAYWADADVEIEGDALLQQGMRFNLLHLLQSVGRDGHTNIAAKGVTGSGYDGHYFWDTEIYVFPAMLYTRPDIARALLTFRFQMLPAARQRAREMSHARGALFPWRTIAGAECSAYFPAGTAQYHINADIAHAVKAYWEVTGDDAFMREMGAELVLETARIWMDLGHFEPGLPSSTPRFCIHTVTGPDEYTAIVNNNLYTNAMAQMHLRLAHQLTQWLPSIDPTKWEDLAQTLGLGEGEIAQWLRAADLMHLPYDAERGIHAQDDSFLSKPRWEVKDLDPAKRPLLLHYHSLVIYRHQICKQADVLLAMLLLPDQFALDDKRRSFDYYEPLTTHDSSLSRCIFGIVASEIGDANKAYAYFADGARADLDNHHHNTQHGVHTAAMAGAWLGVVAGFAGLRLIAGRIHLAPQLPAQWTSCTFKLKFRGAQLQLTLTPAYTRYDLVQGEDLSFFHQGTPVTLRADCPTTIPTIL